jgi:hypothetical protein
LRNFIKIFNDTSLTADQTIAQLKPLFCLDIPDSVHPKFPGMGITDHGPAFYGIAGVSALLKQLFITFKDLQWICPPPSMATAPFMTSSDLNTISFQMDVTGTFQAPWFNTASGHSSPPLSQLGAGTNLKLGRRRGDNSGLAANAVFTFDGTANFLIKQIAVYMDRYAMMQSITKNPGDWVPDAPAYDVIQSSAPYRRLIEKEYEQGSSAGHSRRINITIDD